MAYLFNVVFQGMANLTLNACHQIGCPKMATLHSTRCAEHKRPDYVALRGQEKNSKRHGGRWRKVRHSYLVRHSLCETYGCSELATEVDHKLALALDGEIFKFSNLQALCHRHHIIKTGVDQQRIKVQRSITEGRAR